MGGIVQRVANALGTASRMLRPRMGQTADFVAGGIARQIVQAAEPSFRKVVSEERTRLAGAIVSGLPFATLSTLAFIGTSYLVPENEKSGKAAGYTASAALMAAAIWWLYGGLREPESAPAPETTGPSAFDPIARSAARALVVESEPRLRAILDDERARLGHALKAALPFGVGSLAVLLATVFLVDPANKTLKAAGYSTSALLLGGGAWTATEQLSG